MDSALQVSVAALTRFYLFELAEQLARRGSLGTLHTGYPNFKIPEGLKNRSASYPWILGPMALAWHPSLRWLCGDEANWVARQTFDAAVARKLNPGNVHVGMSGASIKTFRRAKELGTRAVCERASSHIGFQDQILREESEAWGLPYVPIDPRTVAQELEEYELCDRIAVPSKFVEETFIRKGVSPKKLIRNAYGVDLTLFRPAKKNDSTFRILYVGAVSLRKGTGYLLQALNRLAGLPCELWIVGGIQPDGHEILKNCEARVRYLGPVPREQLGNYYSQASVFVMPSIEEGLALVMAQAMACGVPVIATGNTGATDLFTDGKEGFIVPIRSPEAIAEKIDILYHQPALLESMRAACLERVRSFGGWDAYGERAIAHYETLACGSA